MRVRVLSCELRTATEFLGADYADKQRELGRGWASDSVHGGIAAFFECGICAFRRLSARSYQEKATPRGRDVA